MQVAWMEDENIKMWAEGRRFIQSKKFKTSYHRGIKKRSYEAMFGTV